MIRMNRTRLAALLLAALTLLGAVGRAEAPEKGKLEEGKYAPLYREAYEAEYASLDEYMYEFSANFDADEYRRRKTRNMTGTIAEISAQTYDAMVSEYPEVAAYYAAELGSNFGGLGYIVADQAYNLFTDPNAGALFGELLGGAMDFISEWDYAMAQANKNPHPEYAEYALVTGRYTLLKSSGSVSEILEKHSSEVDAIKLNLLALEERELVLNEANKRIMASYQQLGEQYGYLSEEPEMQAITAMVQTSGGKMKAVEDRKAELAAQQTGAVNRLMDRFEGSSSTSFDKQYLYNIVDNNTGEVLGAFCAVPRVEDYLWHIDTTFRINSAGMVSVNRVKDDLPLTILDCTGRVLHRNGGGYVYGNLTPCGNVLRVSRQTSVDYGDHLLVEVVDPSGAVVAAVGHAKLDTLYINEWQVSFDENIENDPLDEALGSHTIKRAVSEVLSELPFRDDVYVRFTEADGKEKKGLLDLSTLTVKKTAFDKSMEQDVVPQLTEPMASKAGSSHIVNSTGFTQINKRYKLDNAASVVQGTNGYSTCPRSAPA